MRARGLRAAAGRLLARVRHGVPAPLAQRTRLPETIPAELSDFFEHAVVGLHWLGPDGRILGANPADMALVGCTADDYVGHSITEFHADPAVAREMIERLGRGETLRNYEAVLRRKDGALRDVLISANTLWQGETFVHARCITRDVSKLKEAERALADALVRERAARAEAAEAGRRVAILAEATNVMTASLDYDTTLDALASLATQHLADWCVLNVVQDGQPSRIITAHADPAKAPILQLVRDFELHDDDTLAGVLRSGEPLLIPEIPDALLTSNTHGVAQLAVLRALTPRSAMVVPLIARGRTLGVLSLVSTDELRRFGPRDLEFADAFAGRAALAVDNARLHRAGLEASRLKDELLAVASHELRTPLTAILAWARILRTHRLDPTKTSNALATIERNAKTQARLIENLLDVSRLTSDTLKLVLKPVALAGVVDAALETLVPAADVKRIALETRLAPDLHTLGDADRLQQIVWHVVANALKFTPEGGHVTVRLTEADGRAEITVTDSGDGMSSAFLPRAFEPFTQADRSSTRSHGGLGLGLAIVRQLVELHGGTVAAHSSGAQRGTTVTVRLPLSAAAETVADPAMEDASATPRRRAGLA